MDNYYKKYMKYKNKYILIKTGGSNTQKQPSGSKTQKQPSGSKTQKQPSEEPKNEQKIQEESNKKPKTCDDQAHNQIISEFTFQLLQIKNTNIYKEERPVVQKIFDIFTYDRLSNLLYSNISQGLIKPQYRKYFDLIKEKGVVSSLNYIDKGNSAWKKLDEKIKTFFVKERERLNIIWKGEGFISYPNNRYIINEFNVYKIIIINEIKLNLYTYLQNIIIGGVHIKAMSQYLMNDGFSKNIASYVNKVIKHLKSLFEPAPQSNTLSALPPDTSQSNTLSALQPALPSAPPPAPPDTSQTNTLSALPPAPPDTSQSNTLSALPPAPPPNTSQSDANIKIQQIVKKKNIYHLFLMVIILMIMILIIMILIIMILIIILMIMS